MNIRLELVYKNLSGLEALDKRRVLGLPDGDSLTFTTNTNQSGFRIPYLNIDEGFARAWFGSEQITSYAKVPMEMLVKGDVQFCNESNDYAVTFANLTPERIKELYVAVRFAACREQVARLQQELDTLKAPQQEEQKEEQE